MKRIIVALLAVSLFLVVTGCGGEEEIDPQALLAETVKAMAGVSGYRIYGSTSTTMEETQTEAESATDSMSMEVSGEVQIVEEVTYQHLTATGEGETMQAYIIGDDYYDYTPQDGWTHSPGRGLGTTALDARQMELVAASAEDIKVIQDGEKLIKVILHLGEDYFRATLDAYVQQLQEKGREINEQWRAAMEEAIGQTRAEVRLWIFRDSRLIESIEMDYEIGGEAAGKKLSSSSHFDLFDYNDPGILVELPEEARQAREAE